MGVLPFRYKSLTECSMTVSRLALIVALGLAAPLKAEPVNPMSDIWCAGRDEIARALTVRQGAELRGQGMRDPDSVVELWADRDGAWTLVVSYADGRTCVVAMGDAWDMVAAAPS
jgi:hypothetical protein